MANVLRTTGEVIAMTLAAVGAGVVIDQMIKNTKQPEPNAFNEDILLTYPYDLPNIKGDIFCIMFKFYKYDRPSILYPPTLIPMGTIALPFPEGGANGMRDMTQGDYTSGAGQDPVAGAALENSKNIAQLNNAVSTGIGISASMGLQSADSLASKSLVNATLQMTGLVQNPFLSVLFNAPRFRRFNLTWTFIPETASDSMVLRNIFDKFKYHQLPDVVNGMAGTLLTYPDMVVPKFCPNKYMFDFKQCVVESSQITYSPGSVISFFPGTNAPTAFMFTLNLLEIEYWVKSDLVGPDGSINPNYHSDNTNFISQAGTPSQQGYVPLPASTVPGV